MGETGIGARVQRLEDKRFITGRGRYTSNLQLAGQTRQAYLEAVEAEAAQRYFEGVHEAAEATAELARYQEQLKGAREEATRMRDDARAEMDDYKAARRAEIDAELAEYRERAKAEADAAKTQALADVKAEVAALAIGAAEQVVQKSLDRETNTALVENFISSVDARS